MKQTIYLLLVLLLGIHHSFAQTGPDYPTAPAASANITRVEFFNLQMNGSDPGFGNGTALLTPEQRQIANYSESINLGALPQGYFRFCIRSQDANGNWSLTHNTSIFDYIITPVYPSPPAVAPNIVRLEYSIDAFPAFGNGTPMPITPSADITTMNAVIDISALAAGLHILYMRSLDGNGKWSILNIRSFSNGIAPPYAVAPAVGNIQLLEYFIDTDPGFGLGTPVNISAGNDVTVSFSINSLAPGNHTLYIRSKENPWGLITAQPFSISTTLPVTWQYVQGRLQSDGAYITWSTTGESNTSHFEIEHSTDGIRYSTVGKKTAAGTSNSILRYDFLHMKPATGKNYYRIKQIDIDDKFTYSAIIPLYNYAAARLVIIPNPVQDIATLYFNNNNSKTIELLNSTGAVLIIQKINEGISSYSLNISRYSPGIYFLKLLSETGTETYKIIKQ